MGRSRTVMIEASFAIKCNCFKLPNGLKFLTYGKSGYLFKNNNKKDLVDK